MADSFQGFAPESFRFFRDLAKNNHKPWFDAHRDLYETHVVGAFRSLLATLEPFLLELNPNFQISGKTNANFSRINRDIRFSKDKAPYKPNYYLLVYDARRSCKTDGYLYVGLSADCLTVGFATYSAWGRGDKSALETVFRPHFSKERALFNRVLDSSVRSKRYETYWHRMEKGNWTQHPGLPRADEDWLSLQAWIVRKVLPCRGRGVGSPALAGQIENIFRDLYPLYVFTSHSSPRWRQELKRQLR
ncbi:MAG TPA: DUF2461 family protein [Terriglobia bacterium]|nr:DUF2461 family protein [Terriglobia bacterium]